MVRWRLGRRDEPSADSVSSSCAQGARIYALLNISYLGLGGPAYEVSNPRYCDLELFDRAIADNLDLVRGMKVRIGTTTVGSNGIEPLRLARQAADRGQLSLMVHVADAPPGISEVLPHLRPRDIITHCFTGRP